MNKEPLGCVTKEVPGSVWKARTVWEAGPAGCAGVHDSVLSWFNCLGRAWSVHLLRRLINLAIHINAFM